MIARAPNLRDGWPLTVASMAAWALLLFGSFAPAALPALCGPGVSLWSAVPAGFDSAFRLTPLPQLLLWWLLMLCAMMLPLLRRPIGAVQAQRGSVPLFLAAYLGVWLVAIAAITLFSLLLHLATEARPLAGEAVALGIAILWQGTAIKANALARCHIAPHPGSAHSGASVAIACIGACWAWMALPPLFGEWHVAAMAIVAALLLYERYAPARAGIGDPRLLLSGTVLALIGFNLALI